MRSERSRKAARKILPIFLTVLAVLAVVGTGLFLYFTPDSAAKAQYKEEAAAMAQGVADKRIAQLGEQTAGLIAEPGGEAPQAVTDEAVSGAPAEVKPQGGVGAKPTLTQEQIATLTASLTGIYDQILADMQQDGMDMVNQLVDQAKVDYQTLKQSNGSDPAAVGKLAAEYMSRGGALEDEMDSSFSAVLQAMREQLTSLGIPPDAIISDYQTRYDQIKAERQKTLIDKALNAIQ